MLEIMGVGDQRMRRIVTGSEVAEERGDHGHRFPSLIEQFDLDASLYLGVPSNAHGYLSLPTENMSRVHIQVDEVAADSHVYAQPCLPLWEGDGDQAMWCQAALLPSPDPSLQTVYLTSVNITV